MKHYARLLKMRCFSRGDVGRVLGAGKANSTLDAYLKRGLLNRVKRDLYVAVDLATRLDAADRYLIGSRVAPDAYLSHHSALEVHGFYNELGPEVCVSGPGRFNRFEYDDVRYRYVAPRASGWVVEKNGARATGLERTIVESIGDFDKIAGLEEVLRCLELVRSPDEGALLEVLENIGRQVLYQKAGYVLSHFQKSMGLSERFFRECEKNVGASVRYFRSGGPGRDDRFDRRWRLVAPRDLAGLAAAGA
ncbi:MAG: transcriptional regulator [Deltaproteobacteria bacterium]|jgi:predicted transcriptional regulator of viral defense system|nr:transcriptional regulator [Deltaproteobacteria bacterium]